MLRVSARFGASCERNLPKFLAKTQMRSNDCQSFRVEIGHVHRVANGAFEQRGTNRVRDLNAQRSPVLPRWTRRDAA